MPDHRVKQVSGATYSGFYYICYHRDTNTITGYYYHKNSEWFVYSLWFLDIILTRHSHRFQHLVLAHVPEHAFASFEFR